MLLLPFVNVLEQCGEVASYFDTKFIALKFKCNVWDTEQRVSIGWFMFRIHYGKGKKRNANNRQK